MTLAEVRAWAHVKQSETSTVLTTDPEGYRALCQGGWLEELPAEYISEAARPVYRFRLTLAGSIQRDADRPYQNATTDA